MIAVGRPGCRTAGCAAATGSKREMGAGIAASPHCAETWVRRCSFRPGSCEPLHPDPGSPAQASASQSMAAPLSRSPSPVCRVQSEDPSLLPGSAFAIQPDPRVWPSCSGCLSDFRSLQPRKAVVRFHLSGRGIRDLAIASSPPSPVRAALLGMSTPGCRPKPLREKRSFVRPPWRTITSSGASCLPCSGNPPTALGNLGIPPRVRFHSSACRLRSGSLVPARASFRSFRRRPLPPITLAR